MVPRALKKLKIIGAQIKLQCTYRKFLNGSPGPWQLLGNLQVRPPNLHVLNSVDQTATIKIAQIGAPPPFWGERFVSTKKGRNLA